MRRGGELRHRRFRRLKEGSRVKKETRGEGVKEVKRGGGLIRSREKFLEEGRRLGEGEWG